MSDLEANISEEPLQSDPPEAEEAPASPAPSEAERPAPSEGPRLPEDDPLDAAPAVAPPSVRLGHPLPTLGRPLREPTLVGRRVLNLGCGTDYTPGALNVDRYDRTVCDVVADGALLPLGDGALDEVRLRYALEPLGYLGALDVLAECCRVLRAGGSLLVETPDATEYCRAFLDDAGEQGAPAGLRWLLHFEARHDRCGSPTSALLPERLLSGMLAASGFELEGPAEAGSTGGSLLLRGRRVDGPHVGWLASVRRNVTASGLLRGWAPVERLELERRYFDTLRALPTSTERRAQVGALDTLLLHPELAAIWIGAARDHGVALPVDLEELAALSERAALAGIDRLLWAAVARVATTPHEQDAPLEMLQRCGLQTLRAAAGDPDADIAVLLDDMLAEELPGHTYGGLVASYRRFLPTEGALLRSRVASSARRILARAVRHLERGSLAAGRQGVQLAANLGQDPLHALWNLAVVQVKVGNLERAISFLRAARLHATTPQQRAALDREEAACLTVLGDEELATPLLQRAAALLGDTQGSGDPSEPPTAGPVEAGPVQPRRPVVPAL